jgi:xanthine dehydrogenase accessory factor
MRELLPDIENWLNAGEKVALATVISTWGSAPRKAGSTMAVNERGDFIGSVSGGCVEGAVIQAAKEVIKSQQPQRLHFGVADVAAWDVGLACGGEIDIFLQPAAREILQILIPRLKEDKASVLNTVIAGLAEDLGKQGLTDESGQLLAGSNGTLLPRALLRNHPTIVAASGTEVFVNPLPASPTLVIIGGVHIAIALSEFARALNFRAVVVDPRKAFGSTQRFQNVDELLQVWPQAAFEKHPLNSSTAVASLSHDPKIDDPALMAALNSNAFYVGALGSKKTQEKRRQRLLKAGVSEEKLAKLNAPIGVEIGAETPEEIALAIMAQVIAAYRS